MRETAKQCDEALVMRLAEDLDRGFEDLVLAYQTRLYGFALRITGSSRDAEEAAQDAFIRSYRALQEYPPERIRALALKPWLYQIALNVCRNLWRKRRVPAISLDAGGDADEEAMDLPDAAEQRPEALFEQVEIRAQLAGLVAALPERYRVAVVLRFVQDLSYAEVATVLGQPVGTAKANVHRAIRLLRAAMSSTERVEAGDRRGTDER